MILTASSIQNIWSIQFRRQIYSHTKYIDGIWLVSYLCLNFAAIRDRIEIWSQSPHWSLDMYLLTYPESSHHRIFQCRLHMSIKHHLNFVLERSPDCHDLIFNIMMITSLFAILSSLNWCIRCLWIITKIFYIKFASVWFLEKNSN